MSQIEVNKIICGDCLEVMKDWPDNAFDGIITDPPYGLGFMGKDWDTFKPGSLSLKVSKAQTAYEKSGKVDDSNPNLKGRKCSPIGSISSEAGSYDFSLDSNKRFQQWFTVWAAECLRIAKPGAIMLCFGGTRTYHRLTCAIEDAGWQIRDCVMWLYGSGFPKSHNISKVIDKHGGKAVGWFGKWLRQWREENNITQKEVAKLFPSKTGGLTGCVANWELGLNMPTCEQFNLICKTFNLPFESIKEAEREILSQNKNWGKRGTVPISGYGEFDTTAPATDLAKLWDGYGTALKPAWEPICVAMKPLDGTFAQNAEKWGVAGLNIDGGRIGTETISQHGRSDSPNRSMSGRNYAEPAGRNWQGRWPANVILDEEAGAMLDEQSGVSKSSGGRIDKKDVSGVSIVPAGQYQKGDPGFGDIGGASRFFYCAKASRAERNAGLEGMPEKRPDDRSDVGKGIWTEKGTAKQTNHHPTVKPLKLMEYLCRLLKPPTEHPILLDPFTGSGTTLMAAVNTGWDYVGIEKEKEYCPIAERRIAWAIEQRQGQQSLFERS